jgi:diaminopimelate epimerase
LSAGRTRGAGGSGAGRVGDDGRVQFTKGHGTANDFVILPDPDGVLELTPALVAGLCDRRRGIGADGLLRVVRTAGGARGSAAGDAEWFMDYWNADGSLAEMCGNGVRVFTRYLLDAGLATPDEAGIRVLTPAGTVRVLVRGQMISVDMGRPRIGASGRAVLGDLTLPGTAVDCGNPHLVCHLPAGLELASLDLTRQPAFDRELFPTGVNIEFVTVAEPVDGADLHLVMRVHERGSGETHSCGSGACAVAAVGLRDAGLASGTVAVDLPGGRLTITVDRESCWLTGPAVLVAHGEVDPATLPGTRITRCRSAPSTGSATVTNSMFTPVGKSSRSKAG